MEPMLLEDYKCGKVPPSISNILHVLQTQKSSDKNDIIVALIYILMLESDFIPQHTTNTDCNYKYQRILDLSKSLPDNWKCLNSYKMEFNLTCAPQIKCTIICISVSDDLLINCTVKEVGQYSLLLDPLTYFIKSNVDLAVVIFQNLDLLSRNFKNVVAFPAKVGIIGAVGGVCPCMQHLPCELHLTIMSYLNPDDIMNLAQTCRSLCVSAENSGLWVKILDLDFRRKGVFKTYEELRFLYELKYARQFNKFMTRGPDR